MLRTLEVLAVLVGFALFVAGLMGDGRDGPIIGMMLGIALIETPHWLPCVIARSRTFASTLRRISAGISARARGTDRAQ